MLMQKFLSDSDQVETVRKFLVPERFDVEPSMSNERIGEEYRARERARDIIDKAFQEMTSFRVVTPDKEGKNPAR